MDQQINAIENTQNNLHQKTQIYIFKEMQAGKITKCVFKTDDGSGIPSQEFVNEAFETLERYLKAIGLVDKGMIATEYTLTLHREKDRNWKDPIKLQISIHGQNITSLRMYGWNEIPERDNRKITTTITETPETKTITTSKTITAHQREITLVIKTAPGKNIKTPTKLKHAVFAAMEKAIKEETLLDTCSFHKSIKYTATIDCNIKKSKKGYCGIALIGSDFGGTAAIAELYGWTRNDSATSLIGR